MNIAQLNVIKKLHAYLDRKKSAGIAAFNALSTKLIAEPMDLIGITFTYENIEVYARKDNQDQLWMMFFGILSQAEIDEITRYDFDDDDANADFQYYNVSLEICRKMILSWIVDCFCQTNLYGKERVPIFYKDSIDGMEILRLNDLQTFQEASELQTFIKNSQSRTMDLFRMG